MSLMISPIWNQDSKCIDKATLESLGFTEVLAEPVDNAPADDANKACKGFDKVCIDPEKLKEVIKGIMTNYKDSVKTQLKAMARGAKVCAKTLFKYSKASDKRKEKIAENLPADLKTNIDLDVKEKCTDTECTMFDSDSIEDMNNNKDCYKMLVKGTMKGLCYLASDKSHSDFTSPDSDLVSKIKAKENLASLVFEKCSGFIQKQCSLVNCFRAINFFAKKNDKAKKTAEIMNKACDEMKKINDCKDDLSTCDASIKNTVIEGFMKPAGKDIQPGPTTEDIESDEKVSTEAETEIENTSESRLLQSLSRLLETSTASGTCFYEFSSSGLDLETIDTGIDEDEFSGSLIWSFSIISLITFMFK